MNKKTSYIIILALLFGLTIGTVFTDYAKQLGALLADASTPNPGHSLLQIEGSEDLATKDYVGTAINNIGIGNYATKTYVNDAISGIGGYVPTSRTISTGSGLSGGGDLTANRTLTVDSTVIRTTGNQTLGGTKTFSSAVVLSTAGTATNHAVRADRSISTGSGLSGGGNLTANRTLTVDSTVVRTTGDQSIGGTKTFTGTVIVQTPLLPNHVTTKAYVDDLVGGVVVPGGRTAGDTGVGYLLYAGTTRTAGRLYGGTTAPSGTTRLNYDGYLYATQLYDGGTRVAISTRSISTGSGLSGGGNLTANRTLTVDSTVIRTTGNQTLGGTKTFSSNVVVPATPTADNHAASKGYVDSNSGASNWTVSGSNIYRSSGNVGIGTASPTAKLHVAGNIIASDPTAENHVATKDYVDGKSIPSGMISMFDASCPAGWTRVSALDGRYPRGAVAYGETGTDGTHGFHLCSPHMPDECQYVANIPYINVIWCRKN